MSVTLGLVFIAFFIYIHFYIVVFRDRAGLVVWIADSCSRWNKQLKKYKDKRQDTASSDALARGGAGTDESRGQVVSKPRRLDFGSHFFLFFTLPTQSHL